MYHLIEDSGLSPDSPERKTRLVPTVEGGFRYSHAPRTNKGRGATMLAALANGSIFEVSRSRHGPGFRIEEACDHYHDLFLTPEQLYQLGTELREMAESLIPPQPAAPPPAPSGALLRPPRDRPA